MASTKPSPTVTPIANNRSRASRAADKAAADQTQPTPAVKSPAAKPTPAPKPEAKIDLGATQVTVWMPTAVLPDGTQVACSHTDRG
jgi:hypothetical protein